MYFIKSRFSVYCKVILSQICLWSLIWLILKICRQSGFFSMQINVLSSIKWSTLWCDFISICFKCFLQCATNDWVCWTWNKLTVVDNRISIVFMCLRYYSCRIYYVYYFRINLIQYWFLLKWYFFIYELE